MALEARAEERLTRGFTSMTAYSKLSGFKASCTLQPPTIPRWVMMSRDALRSIWNSLSARVWVGATTMESPVWTPTGSRFSMEQTAMTLPTESRMVSNSISFQPKMAFSTRIWVMGEASRPVPAMIFSSSGLLAAPPPAPPRVKAGRTMTG